MSRSTHNAVRLFMGLQNLKSEFADKELPEGVESDFNKLIESTRKTIEVRQRNGI